MAPEMTGQERVLAALRRQEPDRVPTFEWEVDSNVVARMTNGGNLLDFVDMYDLDAVVTRANYRKEVIGPNRFLTEWGITQQKGLEEHPASVDSLAPIKSWADWEKYQIPDPYAEGRFETLKEMVKRYKGRKAIILQTRDVFAHPRDLLGYENFLVACLEQSDLVTDIIEKTLDHNIKIVQRAAELGADLVYTGDDLADTRRPLVSPRLWKKIFQPYFVKFVQAIHDAGLLYWKHSDGNLMPLLDMLVEAGIDGIDPIDPLAGMDIAAIKRDYGDRVAIKGNVDCAYLLVSGTPEQVESAVKYCLRVAAPGGGYALSSSNTIHSGVKPELYLAMRNALRKYGTYPLDMDALADGRPPEFVMQQP